MGVLSSMWACVLLSLFAPSLAVGLVLPPWCSTSSTSSTSTSLTSCQFGLGRASCGVEQCLKGPGEMCGGPWHRYGKCAEGLVCSACHRCQGCSFISFTCWQDEACF